jgi:signal transduction histidine kinase
MNHSRDPLGSLEHFAVAEEIAALVRHELRNRLGAIRNSSYFLKRKVEGTQLWESEPRVAKFFGLIEDEVVAADALIRAKLAVAELCARNVALVPLARCVDRALSCLRIDSLPEVATMAADVLVEADVDELALAIRALLENALEAAGSARLEVSSAGARLRVVVTDDGPGMSFEQAMRPLFTTKPGRLGLGLNVAERIARRHSGSIVVDASERGARVALELPAKT